MKREINRSSFAKRAVFSAALMAFTATSAAAESSSNVMSDGWLKTKLVTAYTLNRHLSPFEIDTEITNGKAKLTGTVESGVERELAERIAMTVDGITSVDNQLKIEGNVTRKDNAFFNSVEDATTAASVYTRILSNRNISPDGLKVLSRSGVVTMTGNVRTDAERELAELVALDTSGVRKVDNKISLSNAKPSVVEKAGNAFSDTWITTKVRSNLIFSSGTSGSDVSIDTKNGVVQLDGQARTAAQKELIERIANDVSGVKGVRNDLQVTARG